MAITVGVYIGKKDRLIRYWYEILPRGQFPILVKYCIQTFLRGTYFPLATVCDRELLKEQILGRKDLPPTQRNVTFTEEDGPVYEWVDQLMSGYRSEEIKNILKQTILHTLVESDAFHPAAHPSPSSTLQVNQREQGIYPTMRAHGDMVVPKANKVSSKPENVSLYPHTYPAVSSAPGGYLHNMPLQSLKKDRPEMEDPYDSWDEIYHTLSSRNRRDREETQMDRDQAEQEFHRLVNRLG
jgi:hypothetical protein